jgi:hypothetical protein
MTPLSALATTDNTDIGGYYKLLERLGPAAPSRPLSRGVLPPEGPKK